MKINNYVFILTSGEDMRQAGAAIGILELSIPHPLAPSRYLPLFERIGERVMNIRLI
jgi:hypothetical protein